MEVHVLRADTTQRVHYSSSSDNQMATATAPGAQQAAVSQTSGGTSPEQAPGATGDYRSVFVSEDADVYDVPMSVIRRPIPSELSEGKVQQFMADIQKGDKMTPIEVMWVETEQGDYYFATGGCHRWEAYKRLHSETIPAKLIKVPPSTLSVFMGASSPFNRPPVTPPPPATV